MICRHTIEGVTPNKRTVNFMFTFVDQVHDDVYTFKDIGVSDDESDTNRGYDLALRYCADEFQFWMMKRGDNFV